MTNEEAREILEKLIPQPQRGDGKSITHLMITEALTMAIKALEQEPCEDAISRRALLDNLEKPMNWTDSEAELQEQRDYEGFIELVQSMPPVTPQQTRWIPIKEELPEIGRYVLVHLTDSYYDNIQIMSLHLGKSTEADIEWIIYWKTQEESIEFDVEDVIAWQPLPTPYKVEGSDKECNSVVAKSEE